MSYTAHRMFALLEAARDPCTHRASAQHFEARALALAAYLIGRCAAGGTPSHREGV